jgi:outer membrane protein W
MALMAVSVCVHGKNKTKQPTTDKKITIGFRAGKEFQLNPGGRQVITNNTGIIFRRPVSNRFKVEGGINYGTTQNQCCISSLIAGNSSGPKPYKLTLPASIQYYMLPKCCKLQPFMGAGLQYNFSNRNTTLSPFTGDARKTYNTDNTGGTQYISILFTQGVTFEVNTRIQITQSFHFMPDANKTIGIDLGIGYRLP